MASYGEVDDIKMVIYSIARSCFGQNKTGAEIGLWYEHEYLSNFTIWSWKYALCFAQRRRAAEIVGSVGDSAE